MLWPNNLDLTIATNLVPARLARKLGKPVFAIVGRATKDREVHELFDGVYENVQPGMSQEENMKRAAELLGENARELAKSL